MELEDKGNSKSNLPVHKWCSGNPGFKDDDYAASSVSLGWFPSSPFKGKCALEEEEILGKC